MTKILIKNIIPNPEQPRKEFDQAELDGLASSIQQHGLINSISVEGPHGDGIYVLIDGERRWRAAAMAGLLEIDALVRPGLNGQGPQERLTLALTANLQRADMNPIEEANAFKQLQYLGLAINAIALKLGTTAKRVSDRLMLLKFEEPIQDLISRGRLSKDYHLVTALLDLPAGEVRIKTAKALADRNVTIKAGVEACQRVQVALRSQKIEAAEVPALRITTRQTGEVNRMRWDALMHIGKVPPWPLVEIAARETCDKCGLRDMASVSTCKNCAMVDMLVAMVGRAK